jgi:phage tail protein X
MISRYKNNRTKRTSDGRLVYRSKIYPNIPLRDDDIYVVTDIGDRLDALAYKYYNNASLWWIIATANNLHDAPLGIKEGIVLRIPQNYIQIVNKFNR